MPAAKRKADGPVEVALIKRQRCLEATLTEDQLETMTNEELIKSIKSLQQALRESQVLAETSGNVSKQSTSEIWPPEKIAERAEKVRELCRKEIKKQMKWQPSCKRGSTKWSYTGIVPDAEVFKAVFSIEKGAKPFKLKKIDMRNFEDIVGDICVSCRYSYLSITGSDVNLRWNAEELTFQLSGTYGIDL